MKFVRPINDPTPNVTNPFSTVHRGVDYGYSVGTPVYACADGKVTVAKSDESRQWIANSPSDPFKPSSGARSLITADYGNYVKISHDENYQSICAHLKYQSVLVKTGDIVKKGQMIGAVGSTGNSTGNHLHWEPRLAEKAVDPTQLMEVNFNNYFQVNNMSTISVETVIYEKLVNKSTKWDQTHQYLELTGTPEDTSFDEGKRVIAGFKSRVTDIQNQLNTERAERQNREEQVGRLKIQLTEEQALRTSLNENLREATEKVTSVSEIYEKRISVLQTSIDQMGKEKGELNTQIIALTQEVAELKKNVTATLTIGDLIFAIFNRIKNVRII